MDNKGFISTSIWVDFIHVNGNDTTYYLNRIVVECDTCPSYYNETPQYAFYNRPQFLQKEVHKTDSTYCFVSPQKFIIKPETNVGESWIFDSTNSITATIVGNTTENIFEMSDSVKIIALSTSDTLVISKSFGILKFDSVYNKSNCTLTGINNIYGDSVPDFYDIFDFSVGDVYEYDGFLWPDYDDPYFPMGRYFLKKLAIQTKINKEDTLQYDVYVKHLKSYSTFPQMLSHPHESDKSYSYSTTLTFINSPHHPVNRFNDELIEISSIPEMMNGCGYNYTRLRCNLDSIGIYTKLIGSLSNHKYFGIYDTFNNILIKYSDIPCYEENVYKTGLGRVCYEAYGFEFTDVEMLHGYIIGDDTTGIITSDEKFIVGINQK